MGWEGKVNGIVVPRIWWVSDGNILIPYRYIELAVIEAYIRLATPSNARLVNRFQPNPLQCICKGGLMHLIELDVILVESLLQRRMPLTAPSAPPCTSGSRTPSKFACEAWTPAFMLRTTFNGPSFSTCPHHASTRVAIVTRHFQYVL